MWTPRTSLLLGVGDDLHEAVMRVEDGSLRVADEGELADLDVIALLLGLRLGEADACNLRLGVGATRDVLAVDWLHVLAGDACGDDHAGHDFTCELRQARRR